jgi:hypothetical protein
MLLKIFISYDISAVEGEIVKNDFLGFNSWWADVCSWWSYQIALFSAYIGWILVIGSVILLVLYGVTKERKFISWVLIGLIVYFFWQGVEAYI